MAKSDPADMSMMFGIHKAFRRDLARLAAAVAVLPAGAKARADELAERWAFVALALHHHHTGEDDHIWPLVQRKAPDCSGLLEQMRAEHQQIDPLIVRVARGFDRVTSGDDAARDELAADLRALGDTLGAHLDHEEREAVPVVAKNVTQGELKEFSNSQRRSMKPSQVAIFIPWVLEDLPDADRKHLLGEFPAPLRLLVNRRWVPRYARQSAALWG